MEWSILEGIAFLAELGLEIEAEVHHALKTGGEMICEEAKAEIGNYQEAAGPTEAWSPLAESTMADREQRGYPADEPLLRDGSLRESITYVIGDHEVTIGSDSEVAVYQELGTSKIPPRSFLVGAAYRKENEVVDKIGEGVALRIVK